MRTTDGLLNQQKVADMLGVSTLTIENWVNAGDLPPAKKLRNRYYWHPAIFHSWLTRRIAAERAHLDAESLRLTRRCLLQLGACDEVRPPPALDGQARTEESGEKR